MVDDIPILTTEADLAGYVGRIVTLRGVVARSKEPTLLGVDVDAPQELAGRRAEATGRLVAYEVEAPADPFAAHRSPGSYYALHAEHGLAQAVVSPDPER